MHMNLISIYNVAQVIANCASLGICLFSSDNMAIHTIVRCVECAQLLDIVFALFKITKSNVATVSIQTIAKSVVVVYGQTTYIRYLGAIWAISDAVRYAYYVCPSVCFIKSLRYSQYKVLYPIGIGLEIATIMPVIADPYIKVFVGLAYVFFGPYMFNNTSIMETQQRILTALRRGTKAGGDHTITYGKTVYAYDELRFRHIRMQFAGSRFKWTMADEKTATLKDYGIQISWRLVYLIEYFGALVAFALMAGGLGRIDTTLWIAHYVKRLWESAFVHSFSSDTMPLANVFKNSAYYWGAGLLLGYNSRWSVIEMNMETGAIVMLWCMCQATNGYCHWYLANLRSGKATKEHVLPTNWLFRWVVCPNYSAEILGWALFALLGFNEWNSYFGVKALFCCIGAAQMYMWASGKRRRYKKLFGDKYKVAGNLLPGI
jgi:very-long-chain enoyl-CoA reductase